MLNCIHKARYVLMNVFGIKAKKHYKDGCETILRETFTNLASWVTNSNSNILASRRNGVTISIKVINGKGYICPNMMSRAEFRYGEAIAQITTNPHLQLENIFSLRNKDMQWGFKITNDTVYIIFPFGIAKRHLYHMDEQHTYIIDFNPKTDKIYWLIDDIVVYELPDTIAMNKRVYFALNTVGNRLKSKDLPLSMKVDLVNINLYVDEPNE